MKTNLKKMIQYKICRTCGIEKPLNNLYFWRHTKSYDGFRHHCKDCMYDKELKKHKTTGRMPSTVGDKKRCPTCKKYLSFNNFYPDTKRAGGFTSVCKKCRKKVDRARYILKTYGATDDFYYDLLKKQDGVCAICGKEELNQKLAIDHDHITGKLRGLLCRKCNPALGLLGDNIEMLEKAIRYLKKYK